MAHLKKDKSGKRIAISLNLHSNWTFFLPWLFILENAKFHCKGPEREHIGRGYTQPGIIQSKVLSVTSS